MNKPKFIVSILSFIGFILMLVGCKNPSYTVSFIVNDTTETAITTEGSLSELPEGPSINGYTFDGWFLDEEYKVELTTSTEITSDINVYAKLSVITYTIEYKGIEGVTNNNPTSYTVESDTITLSDLSKEGYSFDGWYNDNNNEVKTIEVGSTGNLKLTAHWTATSNSITYENLKGASNPNQGGFNVETPTINLQSLPDVTGYTFKGWIDAQGNTVTSIPQGTTTNVILTAVWDLVEYTITYTDTLGADKVNNPETYTIETKTFSLTSLSKTGYTFDGWFNGNNKVEKIEVGSTGNLALEARWTATAHSITYNNTKDATNVNPGGFNVETPTINLQDLSDVTGYTFKCWIDASGNNVTSIPQGTTTNVTLTAVWDLVEYTITYTNELELDNPSSTTYTVESESVTLANFTSETYTLAGWYDASGNLVESVSPSRAESLTLIAKLIETAKINKIQYTDIDHNIKVSQTFSVETFNASCFNELGEYLTITCIVNGEVKAGEIISVTLKVEDADVEEVTISNIKVYGPITLETHYIEYVYLDQVNSKSFTAKDSFGDDIVINFPTDFEYGDTITITAMDAAGNRDSKEFYVEKASTDVFKYSIDPYGYGGNIKGLTDYGKGFKTLVIPSYILEDSITRVVGFTNNTTLEVVILPSTVIGIGQDGFMGCTNLKSINLECVKVLYHSAFYNCTSLESIEFSSCNFRKEGDDSKQFMGCTNLKSVILGEMTYIPGNAFNGCTSLESIIIPSSVDSISYNSFAGCTNLTFYCEASEAQSGWERNWNSNRPVYYNYVANRIGYTLDIEDNNIKLTDIDKLTKDSLNAYCADEFGIAYEVTYKIEGKLEAGNTVTITLSVEGNTDIVDVVLTFNIYGTPTLESDFTNYIYLNQANASSFIAKDSFGTLLDVKITGVVELGSQITVKAIDIAGNEISKIYTVVDNDFVTNRIYYNEDIVNVKVTDELNANFFNAYGFDESKNALEITCDVNDSIVAGKSATIKLSVNGNDNITAEEFTVQVYGTPTLESIYTTQIPLDEAVTSSFKSLDSFGNEITVQINGTVAVGETVGVSATDAAGNIKSLELTVIEASSSIFNVSGSAITGLTEYGKTLTSIVIPESIDGNVIKEIDNSVFKDNKNLISITLPNTLITISDSAFQNCSNLKSIVIPSSVEMISSYAFSGCLSLESVTIAEGVKEIYESAFEYCTSLKSVVIPSSVTLLEDDIFNYCTGLESFTLLSSNITEMNCLNYCTSLITVEFPETLTTITRFIGCTSLKTIDLKSVTTIGEQAFYGCTGLESIIIPSTVTTIYGSPFLDCSKLTIYCEASETQEGWESGWNSSNCPVYYNFVANKIVYTLDIDSNNIKITDIDKLTIEALNAYCADAKANAYEVTYKIDGTLEVGNTVTITLSVEGNSEIEDIVLTFNIYDTPTLESAYNNIIYYDQVVASSFIARDSFGDSITVDLPDSYSVGDVITVTATDAAGNTVSIELTVLDTIANVFNVSGSAITGLTEYGKTLTNIVIPKEINEVAINEISANAFKDDTNLVSVVIPESILTIGNYAFNGCTSLKNVIIPTSVTTLGEYAFSYCTSLESFILLSENIIELNTGLLMNCEKLTYVEFPTSVSIIGGYAFAQCYDLQSINLKSVESIYVWAFMRCTSLTSIVIPSTVTVIRAAIFKECSSSLTIYCEGSAPQAGWNSQWNSSNCPVYYNFVANKIGYTLDIDSNNIKLTDIDKLTEESLNAYCADAKANAYEVTYKIEGKLEAGNTVTITISVEGNTDIEDVVLTFNIYDTPTLESEYTNIIYYDQVVASSFIAKDSFGDSITVDLPDSYSVGDVITVTATDAAGNTVSIELTVLDTIANIFTVSESAITGLTEYGKTLTSIVIPEQINDVNINEIADEAFSYCTNLVSITIPETIEIIGVYAFEYCISLKSVVIPSTVRYIFSEVFYYCSNLTIYCEVSEPQVDWYPDWNSSNCPVYYNFVANKIGYTLDVEGSNIKLTEIDKLSEESLNAYCADAKANAYEVTYKIEGKLEAGNTVTITISVEGNTDIEDVVLTFNIYDTPTLESEFASYYIYIDQVNTSAFTAKDSFGTLLDVEITGVVSLCSQIIVKAIDKTGNEVSKTYTVVDNNFVANQIYYNEEKVDIKLTDIINTSLFNAYCYDEEGNTVDITCEVVGEQIAGESVIIKLSVNDNENITSKEFTVKIYGTPTIESDLTNYIYIEQAIPSTFTAKDSFGTILDVEIVNQGSQITVKATDKIGNEISKIYTIIDNDYVANQIYYNEDKLKVKVTDTLDSNFFNAYCLDETGNAFDIVFDMIGEQVAGETITIILSVNGNESITSKEFAVQVYGTPTLESIYTTQIPLHEVVASSFNALDSFGNVLSVKITGNAVIGETITVTAIDALGSIASIELIVASAFDVSGSVITGVTDFGKTLTKIVIPTEIDGVIITEIAEFAFYQCTSLANITLPSTLKIIGSSAFRDCTILNNIVIPSTVETIGAYAFGNCTGLTSIIIPESVESLGGGAFRDCTNLQNVNLLCDIDTIGAYTFFFCSSLASITIPSNVKTIGDDSFFGCKALTEIIIPSTVETIDAYAFGGCTGLTSIIIPKSVTTMGTQVFQNLNSLTIYCEIAEADMPATWKASWNSSNCPVVWGYEAEETN